MPSTTHGVEAYSGGIIGGADIAQSSHSHRAASPRDVTLSFQGSPLRARLNHLHIFFCARPQYTTMQTPAPWSKVSDPKASSGWIAAGITQLGASLGASRRREEPRDAGHGSPRIDFNVLSLPHFDYNQENVKLKAGQIRLITLLPSSLSTDVRYLECKMQVFGCDTNPKYRALSYTWGSPKRSRAIIINGQSLLVTESVEIALRRLQRKEESVNLWVDQLCINQDDDDEKSVQVSMMGAIYAKSTETVVWLGPTADSSDAAMDFLNEIGKEASEFGLTQHPPEVFQDWSTSLIAKDDPYESMKLKSELLYQRVKERWPLIAYSAFVQRRWFHRIWIIQEFSISGEVIIMCGDREITYSYFRDAEVFFSLYKGRLLQELQGATASSRRDLSQEEQAHVEVLKSIKTGHITGLISTRQKVQKLHFDHQKVPLLLDRLLKRYQIDVVDNNPELECKDPRDRIFGLLTMAEDAERIGLRPDYHKNCIEVYTETARKLIQAGYVDILAQSQWPKTLLGLPSWVPDWAGVIYEPIGDVHYKPIFKASGGSKQRPQADEAIKKQMSPDSTTEQNPTSKKTQHIPIDQMLCLKGTCVDKVETIGQIWGQNDGTEGFLREIETLCLQSQLKVKEIYKTEARRLEAKWRVPIADQELAVIAGGRATSTSQCAYNLELLSNQIKSDLLSGTETTKTVLDYEKLMHDPARMMYAYVITSLRNRRAYLTTQGYVGLGPIGMQTGDIVCILFGANFPYILRRKEDETSYTFVGEAYCDGIMDGEFMERDSKQEIFNIY
jgi:hypothetical protein